MSEFYNKYRFIFLFIALGIAGGYVYWRFIGCNSGTCPLTSNWHSSSLAGGIIGYLGGSSLLDLFGKGKS